MNILDVKMQENDAGAATIRDYFKALLTKVFEESEGFSGKRPFGNSGWEFEIYRALITSGHIKGKLDENGDIEDYDGKTADKLIHEAIVAL